MSEFNTTDKIADETVEQAPAPVLAEPMPVVEEMPVVSETEPVAEAAAEETPKRKSFFDMFKKDKDDLAVKESTDAAPMDDAAAPTEGAAAAEDVPVEETAAKKRRFCGMCCKKDAPPAAAAEETVEEAAEAEETPAGEPVVEPPMDTPVPVEEAPAAEEPTYAAAAAPEEGATTEEEVAVPEVTAADIARCGVMHKSGKFFKSHFNERHCRLLHTGAFQWSKSDDFSAANECMITGETTTVAFMAEGESAPHKYRFEVHCGKDMATFACDTEEDRDEWVRAFETVRDAIAPTIMAGLVADPAVDPVVGE